MNENQIENINNETNINTMEDPNKSNKSNKMLGISFLVLAIVGFAFGFIIGFSEKDDTEKKDETSTSATTASTTSAIAEDTCTADKDFKFEKYYNIKADEEYVKLIPTGYNNGLDFTGQKDAYIGTLVTVNDIDKNLIVSKAFNAITSCKEENMDVISATNVYKERSGKFEGILDVDTLNKFSQKYYNTSVENNSFEIPAGEIRYENGYFFRILAAGGGLHVNYFETIETKKENEDLIILQKALFTKFTTGTSDVTVCKTSLCNQGDVITTFTYSGESLLHLDLDDIKQYITNANTFKHTFKKNSDGTYYWYSSEVA